MADTTPLTVVLDANVLFPWSLRDTLLRAAEEELYSPRVSQQILEEVTRNLRIRQKMRDDQATYFEAQIQAYLESITAFVTGYEALMPALTNDSKDRHVLAAAIQADAQIVVTFNLKHFPARALSPYDIVAQHPDVFLTRLHALHPDALDGVIRAQAAALKKPPVTVAQLLDTLAQHVPAFVRLMRPRLLDEAR